MAVSTPSWDTLLPGSSCCPVWLYPHLTYIVFSSRDTETAWLLIIPYSKQFIGIKRWKQRFATHILHVCPLIQKKKKINNKANICKVYFENGYFWNKYQLLTQMMLKLLSLISNISQGILQYIFPDRWSTHLFICLLLIILHLLVETHSRQTIICRPTVFASWIWTSCLWCKFSWIEIVCDVPCE